MAQRNYQTIGIDLFEYADTVLEYLHTHGYSVKVEKNELGFPFTPVLVSKREQTKLITLIVKDIDKDRLNEWVSYCSCCATDVRLSIGLPSNITLKVGDEDFLQAKKVGLFIASNGQVIERLVAADLGINVKLPDQKTLSGKIQRLLGAIYERFSRSEWREGFGDACHVLEVEARRYLNCWIKRGRIVLVTKTGKVNVLTKTQINKMTIGQLVAAFSQIRNPNYADSEIGKALSAINKDRIGLIHHKHKKSTEARLRKNVGQHMWTVVSALKHLV